MKSLKLTQKSIEEANRPYIVCYMDYVDVGYFQKYLVIKNFGKTPAIIKSIETDKEIEEFKNGKALDSLNNVTIAPGQKFIRAISNKSIEECIFTITYQELSGKTTANSTRINFGFSSDLKGIKSSSTQFTKDTNELRATLHHQAKSQL